MEYAVNGFGRFEKPPMSGDAVIGTCRMAGNVKTSLERAARRRKVSLSAVLYLAAEEWLKNSGSEGDDDERQRRLQKAASECFGSIASGDTRRSETASATVRQRLRRHYGR